MNQLRPWHYLLLGASRTVCGKTALEVFNATDLAPNVTCTECMKTEEYMAQCMEIVLTRPTPLPAEFRFMDTMTWDDVLKKAPTK